MTTYAEAIEAIADRWVAQWGSTTDFALENEKAKGLADGEAPWAWVTVSGPQGGQETLGSPGNRKYRRLITVTIQVFTRVDTGMAQSALLTEQARDIFEGERFNGLTFNDGTADTQKPDGRWQPVNVVILGDYEETK